MISVTKDKCSVLTENIRIKEEVSMFSLKEKESNITVHSVLSNVAKIHSKLPAAMEFWLVCLGILAYSCQNTSRDNGK